MDCPTTSAFHMETAMAVAATATGEKEADASSPLDLRHAPLLLFDHDGKASDGDDASFLFYSIPSKQVVRRRMDEMKDHRYWTTPQGWLVMAARSSPDTFLWDPFTGTRVSLPLDHAGFLRGDGPKRCLVSCKPVATAAVNPSCGLVVLVVDLAETVFWYCRLGVEIDRWLKHDYEPPVAGDKTLWLWYIRTLTSVGDKFFMEHCDKVVMFEFSPEPLFTVIPLEMDRDGQPPWNGTSIGKLVESQGYLFCVLLCCSDCSRGGCFVVHVAVFKLDLSAQAWVTVKSLDGRVFLVHPQFGASFDPQEASLKGDCIYYCMPDDKALHVYDMERGTTSLRNPVPYLGDQCSTEVFMPRC